MFSSSGGNELSASPMTTVRAPRRSEDGAIVLLWIDWVQPYARQVAENGEDDGKSVAPAERKIAISRPIAMHEISHDEGRHSPFGQMGPQRTD